MRAQASETSPDAVAPRRIRTDIDSLRAALAAAARGGGVPVDLQGASLTDCFDLLAETDVPCAYFASRDDAREQLAVGRAELRAFAEPTPLARVLTALDGEGPWFGGFRFDPERSASGAWASFGAAYFFRPLVRFVSDGATTTLHVDRASAREHPERVSDRASASLQRLLADAPPPADVPGGPAAAATAPSADSWRAAFDAALHALAHEELDKVVLAQSLELALDAPPRVGRALERCRSESPDGFRFALRSEPGTVFAANSPELLLRADGEHVETEALAGTRPTARADELLRDDKELREQRIVTEAIERRLRACDARELRIEGPRPRAHGRLAHLATSFCAEVDDPRALVTALHPTPAVCGSPRPEALRFLREREGLDRGLYAGGVGVVDAQRIELAVALRCALFRGATATLYAGGGIVRGSCVEAEAREIEEKSALWRKLLQREDA